MAQVAPGYPRVLWQLHSTSLVLVNDYYVFASLLSAQNIVNLYTVSIGNPMSNFLIYFPALCWGFSTVI